MTLYEALKKSWVSRAGLRGAWLGDLEARQDQDGNVTLLYTEFRGKMIFEHPGPPIGSVSGLQGWQPWGEGGER